MNRQHSLHLLSGDGETTRCGKTYRAELVTTSKTEVTCRSCRRTWERSTRQYSERERRARQSATYADNTFPGLGLLTCHVCGRPCVEHGVSERCAG